jgi:hypothetical protein
LIDYIKSKRVDEYFYKNEEARDEIQRREDER